MEKYCWIVSYYLLKLTIQLIIKINNKISYKDFC